MREGAVQSHGVAQSADDTHPSNTLPLSPHRCGEGDVQQPLMSDLGGRMIDLCGYPPPAPTIQLVAAMT